MSDNIDDILSTMDDVAKFKDFAHNFKGGAIPTGCLALDRAIGIGGWPKGRISCVWGEESVGKSTLLYMTIAAAQLTEPDKYVHLIDSENSFDEEYADCLGVDLNKVLYSSPTILEQCYSAMWKFLEREEDIVSAIIWDSAACSTEQAVEAEIGSANIATEARINSQEMKKIPPFLRKKNIPLIFANQCREKPGVTFGNPQYAPGGSALRFWPSVVVNIAGKAKDQKTQTIKSKMRVTKNKVAKPFGECEILVGWGTGIDNSREIMKALPETVIQRGNTYYEKKKVKKVVDGKEVRIPKQVEVAKGAKNFRVWSSKNQWRFIKRIKAEEAKQEKV